MLYDYRKLRLSIAASMKYARVHDGNINSQGRLPSGFGEVSTSCWCGKKLILLSGKKNESLSLSFFSNGLSSRQEFTQKT